MAVVVSGKSSRTVVVDRARTATIAQHRPEPARVPDRRTATTVERAPATIEVSSPGVQGRPGTDGGGGEQVPFFIPANETFTVQQNRQVLFHEPIEVEGHLAIDGRLIDVSDPTSQPL